MTPIVLVGGGGHAKVCIEILQNMNTYQIIGIIDEYKPIGSSVYPPYKVTHNTLTITNFPKETLFLVTIGRTKENHPRKTIYEQLKAQGARFATIIAKNAVVAKTVKISQGTVIMNRAIVHPHSVIGENCVINTAAIVEHDCFIGDHTYVAPAAVINGGVRIGKNCLIGSNAVVLQERTIADDVIVGAGAVVTSDLLEPGVYVGCPAKKIRAL